MNSLGTATLRELIARFAHYQSIRFGFAKAIICDAWGAASGSQFEKLSEIGTSFLVDMGAATTRAKRALLRGVC